ncbi:MAG: hypothetical protein LBE80_01020 [Deltaproteobacteria bacterium]|jgi:hypothetical protein|nr:hypothetical protein [Deltaproteobacteria bacterium]
MKTHDYLKPKAQAGQGLREKGRGLLKNLPQAGRALRRLVLVFAVVAILGLFSGCQTTKSRAGLEDPALTALGQASVKIMDERMKSPFITLSPTGEVGSKLSQVFVLDGVFVGAVSEALMGLAKALNYGLVLKNARAGRLFVTIGPSEGDRTIVWLIGDLNKQLKKDRAVIGIDSVNKRLVLSASEVDR